MKDFHFFISSPPDTALQAGRLGQVSLMAYRVGRSFRLERAALPNVRCALMEVDMTGFTGYGPHQGLAEELTRECCLRGYGGIVPHLPRPSVSVVRFLETLSRELARRRLVLWLSPAYARVVPGSRLLLPSRGAWGSFRGYVERNRLPGRTALSFSLLAEDFTLPDLTGRGCVLPSRAFAALPAQGFHYSPELEISYVTYVRDGRAHVVLREDERSVKNRMKIGEELDISAFFFPYSAIESPKTVLKNGDDVIK